jgi:hypothetical protein
MIQLARDLWHLDYQYVFRCRCSRDTGCHGIVSCKDEHGDWRLATEAYARAKGHDER